MTPGTHAKSGPGPERGSGLIGAHQAFAAWREHPADLAPLPDAASRRPGQPVGLVHTAQLAPPPAPAATPEVLQALVGAAARQAAAVLEHGHTLAINPVEDAASLAAWWPELSPGDLETAAYRLDVEPVEFRALVAAARARPLRRASASGPGESTA